MCNVRIAGNARMDNKIYLRKEHNTGYKNKGVIKHLDVDCVLVKKPFLHFFSII